MNVLFATTTAIANTSTTTKNKNKQCTLRADDICLPIPKQASDLFVQTVAVVALSRCQPLGSSLYSVARHWTLDPGARGLRARRSKLLHVLPVKAAGRTYGEHVLSCSSTYIPRTSYHHAVCLPTPWRNVRRQGGTEYCGSPRGPAQLAT